MSIELWKIIIISILWVLLSIIIIDIIIDEVKDFKRYKEYLEYLKEKEILEERVRKVDYQIAELRIKAAREWESNLIKLRADDEGNVHKWY